MSRRPLRLELQFRRLLELPCQFQAFLVRRLVCHDCNLPIIHQRSAAVPSWSFCADLLLFGAAGGATPPVHQPAEFRGGHLLQIYSLGQ